MDAARSFMFIGTHFYSAVPLAAARACLAELTPATVAHMRKMGELLREGLTAEARAAGVAVRYSGHPTMPLMLFEDDEMFAKARRFSALAAARGVLLHPFHNWFLSAAHQPGDIEKTVEVCAECFRELKSSGLA
jgi:glutamate-1-semialdehyde 2,1-aminomutase